MIDFLFLSLCLSLCIFFSSVAVCVSSYLCLSVSVFFRISVSRYLNEVTLELPDNDYYMIRPYIIIRPIILYVCVCSYPCLSVFVFFRISISHSIFPVLLFIWFFARRSSLSIRLPCMRCTCAYPS